MPFIAQNLRKVINKEGLSGLLAEGWSIHPGDRCYYYYKKMVDRWKEDPRWTTAHEIYEELQYAPLLENCDDEAAQELAWQVFFQLYVMPYELQKKAENGDI